MHCPSILDALQVQVARVARLVDEHHVVGKALIAGLRGVALGLFPVLERRGDQVHVEALLDEHFGQDAEARVAARLVAELDAHGDHGDAEARARLGALSVGLRIHTSKYTKPAPRRARRTANPHELRRVRVLMGPSLKRHPCAWPELRLLLEVAHSRAQIGLLAPVASYPTK